MTAQLPPPLPPPIPVPKPYPGFWQAMELSALWVAVSIAVAVAAAIVDFERGNRNHEIAMHPAILALASAAATWSVVLLARQRTHNGLRQLFAWVPFPPMAALAGAGMILSASMLGALSFLWIERAFPGSIPRLDYGLSRSRWVALLLITVVAPFSEEILFRGIFLRGFAARYGIVRGIALSSLFFACAHGSLVRIPHTLALGAVLGSIYVQTRSLWASVGGHMLNNLVAGLVLLLGARQQSSPDARFAVPPFQRGELVLAALCLGIFLLSANAFPRRDEPAQHSDPPGEAI